jgi:hypothetical protein
MAKAGEICMEMGKIIHPRWARQSLIKMQSKSVAAISWSRTTVNIAVVGTLVE